MATMSLATWAALPTSVWMRMYAVTTGTDLLASCCPRRPAEPGAERMVLAVRFRQGAPLEKAQVRRFMRSDRRRQRWSGVSGCQQTVSKSHVVPRRPLDVVTASGGSRRQPVAPRNALVITAYGGEQVISHCDIGVEDLRVECNRILHARTGYAVGSCRTEPHTPRQIREWRIDHRHRTTSTTGTGSPSHA